MFSAFAHIVSRLGEKLSELSAQLLKRKRLLSRKSFVNWMLPVSNVRVLPLCWEAEAAALLILRRMIEYLQYTVHIYKFTLYCSRIQNGRHPSPNIRRGQF